MKRAELFQKQGYQEVKKTPFFTSTNKDFSMRPLVAGVITLLLIVATSHLAAMVVDFSFLPKHRKEKFTNAVVAIRDNVPGYQKLATKLFSKPWFNRMYDGVSYLEEKDIVTQERKFKEAIIGSAKLYDSVDIFILAHGNRMVVWLYDIADSIKGKIRLVYNCGCDNYKQGDIWKGQGVKYYLAHNGKLSLSPVFYFFFLKRWTAGCDLESCIKTANAKASFVLRLIGQSKAKAVESCAALYLF
jgi:hypothetical protein